MFINVTVGEEPYRMLQVDNNNRDTHLPVTLAETNTMVYRFERIHLVRKGMLNIKEVRTLLVFANRIVKGTLIFQLKNLCFPARL